MSLLQQMQGMMATPAASGAGDPYWANVLSMMNFAGSDFVDEKTGVAWDNPGSSAVALVSTVGNPFGAGNAAYFNGSAYLRSAGFAFGAGDWTIEAWVNESSQTVDRCLFDGRSSSTAGNGLYVASLTWGSSKCLVSNNSAIILASDSTVPSDVWTHVEFAKASGIIYVFIGGVAAGSVADSRTLGTSQYVFLGINDVGSQFLNAYLGGWRVTGGVARHTTGFTPPTAPFANHA